MLGAILGEHSQYYEGTYYKKKTDVQGQYFRYDLLVEPRKTFGTIINNLIATQGRTTIKTNWNLGYKVGEYIVGKTGRRYTISEIVYLKQDVNPQSAYWLNNNLETDCVISLVEIDNPLELQ